MDWDLLLEEYKTWITQVNVIYNINTGSSATGALVPDIESGVDVINNLFTNGSTSCNILKTANVSSAAGFVMWLKYVKNI